MSIYRPFQSENQGNKNCAAIDRGLSRILRSANNEQGQTVFQLAGGLHRDEKHPSDTISLAEGFITITALVPGMTHHARLKELSQMDWRTEIVQQKYAI